MDALPLFTSGRARLLDNPRLVSQFTQLERRTFSTGKDRIDHGRHGHDDLCNAAAGAMVLAAERSGFDSSYDWVYGKDGPPSQPEPISLWRHPIFQGLGGLYHRLDKRNTTMKHESPRLMGFIISLVQEPS